MASWRRVLAFDTRHLRDGGDDPEPDVITETPPEEVPTEVPTHHPDSDPNRSPFRHPGPVTVPSPKMQWRDKLV